MQNLYLRNRNYYYRKTIPQYLIILFGNKKLYVRSLATKSKTLSIKYVKLLNKKFEHIKESFLMGLDTQLIKQLIDNFHNILLEQTESDLYNTTNPEDSMFALGLENNIKKLQLEYQTDNFSSIYDDLNVILEKLPSSLSHDNIELIAKQFLATKINNLKIIRDKIDNGDYNKPKPILSEQPTSINQKAIEPKQNETYYSFQDTWDGYLKFREINNRSTASGELQLAERTRKILELYFEKDFNIATLTNRSFLGLYNILDSIPFNMTIKTIYRINENTKNNLKPLDEIIELAKDDRKVKGNTKNKYIRIVNEFLDSCDFFEYTSRKLYMQKVSEDDSEDRLPYTDNEINDILSVVTTNTTLVDEESKWIILLAMFQGMQLKEQVQLYKEDILKFDGIWCISINENYDKTVKTKNRVRMIPICTKLLDLGFLDYCNSIEKNNDRLFPNKNAKDFSSWYRKAINPLITKRDNVVMYSMRHSYVNNLYQRENPNLTHISCLVGHYKDEKSNMTLNYTQDIHPKFLVKLVNSIYTV